MKFTNIIWFMIAINLSIGLVNSLGIFTTNYMTVPENSTWVITDVEGSLNQTLTSDADLSVTNPIAGFAMLKDMVAGCFYVYDPLVTIWRAPPAFAAIIQTIVAVSWVIFLIQILTRQSWGGLEG